MSAGRFALALALAALAAVLFTLGGVEARRVARERASGSEGRGNTDRSSG
jgi:hypothetical protein